MTSLGTETLLSYTFFYWESLECTVYPKKYAHGFCFAVLCCGYTLTDCPISIRLTSLALWQSNDCPSASKATLMNMDKYFKWIHYERLHNHNKAKYNKTVCIFLGIHCTYLSSRRERLLMTRRRIYFTTAKQRAAHRRPFGGVTSMIACCRMVSFIVYCSSEGSFSTSVATFVSLS